MSLSDYPIEAAHRAWRTGAGGTVYVLCSRDVTLISAPKFRPDYKAVAAGEQEFSGP
jgi:hypothetical protein